MIIEIFAAVCINPNIIHNSDIVHNFFETDICAVSFLEKYALS